MWQQVRCWYPSAAHHSRGNHRFHPRGSNREGTAGEVSSFNFVFLFVCFCFCFCFCFFFLFSHGSLLTRLSSNAKATSNTNANANANANAESHSSSDSNTKCQMPRTEFKCQMPNAEFQTPTAKFQAPNAIADAIVCLRCFKCKCREQRRAACKFFALDPDAPLSILTRQAAKKAYQHRLRDAHPDTAPPKGIGIGFGIGIGIGICCWH